MKNSQALVDVSLIVRDFLKNEARTFQISKGKMLPDDHYLEDASQRQRSA